MPLKELKSHCPPVPGAYLLNSLRLECVCILGCGSFAYHFQVTVTYTSGLVLRIIVSAAYLILFEVGIPNLACGCTLRWQSVAYHPWVTVTLTSDLVSRIGIESGAYLLYILYIHYSVIVSLCRGPCAQGIYSTHGTPTFMHPLWLQKRNSGCVPPLSYAYLR